MSKQTLVVSHSGASAIHEAAEPPEFYQLVSELTWKDERDKIFLVDHPNTKTYLMDGYSPVPHLYAALNAMVDHSRNRSWEAPPSVATKRGF